MVKAYSKWFGKRTPHRFVLSFTIEVASSKDDGPDVLAHSLSGEAIDSLLKDHKVSGCRILSLVTNGLPVQKEEKR